MSLVKRLLGGAVVSTLLGVMFAGLLIESHFCVTKPGRSEDFKVVCHGQRIAYFVLLALCIGTSLSLSIASWILVHRQTRRPPNNQSEEVRYNALSSPEEEDEAVQIRMAENRRGSVEESQPMPNPYSAFPPAAMYAH